MKKTWPMIIGTTFLLLAITASESDAGRVRDRIAARRAEPTPEARTVAESIVVDGTTRTYRLHVPSPLSEGRFPLVFNFHGLGSDAKEQESVSAMSRLADREGFLVVYPEGLPNSRGKRHWNTAANEDRGPDLAFVRALLAKIADRHPIDEDRVFATGISNGGGMGHMVAVEMPDVFAAIGPVAGAYYNHDRLAPARAIPVVAFHGTADRIVPYEGRGRLPDIREWAAWWAKSNGGADAPEIFLDQDEVKGERWAGAAEVVLYTIKEKGHTWPGSNMTRHLTTRQIDATEIIWNFFKAHPRR